jgi:hypothetical protein
MSFQTPIWGCTVGSGYRFRKGGPKPKFAFVFFTAADPSVLVRCLRLRLANYLACRRDLLSFSHHRDVGASLKASPAVVPAFPLPGPLLPSAMATKW